MASTWSAAPSISALTTVAARSSSSGAASGPPMRRAGVSAKCRITELASAVHGRERVAGVRPWRRSTAKTLRRRRHHGHVSRRGVDGRRRRAAQVRRRRRRPSPRRSRASPARHEATQPTASPSASASRHSLVDGVGPGLGVAQRAQGQDGGQERAPPPAGGRSARTARPPRPCPARGRPRPRAAPGPASPGRPWRTRQRVEAGRRIRLRSLRRSSPAPGSVPTTTPAPTRARSASWPA